MPQRGLFVLPNPDGSGTTPADARKAVAGLFASAGSFGGRAGVLAGLTVTGTSGWAYSIGTGHLATPAGPGELLVWANSAADLQGTDPSPNTGSRIDIIWARHSRRSEGDLTSEPGFGVARGNATTGTPQPPAIPADAIEVARATVPSSATSTSGLTISTANTPFTAARGAPIPVTGLAQRGAITWATLADPVTIYRRDTGRIEINRGDGWRVLAHGAPATYTPALGGSTNPILGAGGVAYGEYSMADRMCDVMLDITWGGSGLQVGAGTYTIPLPVPAAATGSSRVYGTLHLSDAGTTGEAAFVRSSSSDAGLVVMVRANSAQQLVTSSVPWVWAQGDSIRGSFRYPIA